MSHQLIKNEAEWREFEDIFGDYSWYNLDNPIEYPCIVYWVISPNSHGPDYIDLDFIYPKDAAELLYHFWNQNPDVENPGWEFPL